MCEQNSEMKTIPSLLLVRETQMTKPLERT